MGRAAGLVLALVLAGCGVAHGADGRRSDTKHERWEAVEGLPFGTLIEVHSESQRWPDVCQVLSADDSALTCSPEGSTSGVRLVFPREALRDVWVIGPARERHIGLWIGMGIGFAFGGAMCASLGPAGIFACGAAGALIAACIIACNDQGPSGRYARFPGHPGMAGAPPPHTHRKLIYRAAAASPASP